MGGDHIPIGVYDVFYGCLDIQSVLQILRLICMDGLTRTTFLLLTTKEGGMLFFFFQIATCCSKIPNVTILQQFQIQRKVYEVFRQHEIGKFRFSSDFHFHRVNVWTGLFHKMV